MSVEDHLVSFIASPWYSVPVPQVERITSKQDPFAGCHLVFNDTVGSLKVSHLNIICKNSQLSLLTSRRWIPAVRLSEKETFIPLVHIHGGLVVVVADEVHAASPDLGDGDERDGQE